MKYVAKLNENYSNRWLTFANIAKSNSFWGSFTQMLRIWYLFSRSEKAKHPTFCITCWAQVADTNCQCHFHFVFVARRRRDVKLKRGKLRSYILHTNEAIVNNNKPASCSCNPLMIAREGSTYREVGETLNIEKLISRFQCKCHVIQSLSSCPEYSNQYEEWMKRQSFYFKIFCSSFIFNIIQ